MQQNEMMYSIVSMAKGWKALQAISFDSVPVDTMASIQKDQAEPIGLPWRRSFDVRDEVNGLCRELWGSTEKCGRRTGQAVRSFVLKTLRT